MKIAFFSSVLNHHQIEFCDEMYALHGENFSFVSTMEMEEQRKKLKYPEYERPYKIKMQENEEAKLKGEKLFQEADVVILGVLMEKALRKRLRAGKVTFLYKERLFKEKPDFIKYFRSLLYIAKEYWPHKAKPFYMLAASAYSHQDFKSLGIFGKKTFAWGYFPPLKEYQEDVLMNGKESEMLKIFWAGRLLELKNPDYLINVARKLKSNNLNFQIDIAGNGPLEDVLKMLITESDLDNEIVFRGAMPQEKVREYMEKANLYLFTSNREEGFGAVLFEAMNSGCAVVASETAGATGLLISDGINGRVYKNDSADELCDIVLELAKNPGKIRELGLNAYKTMLNEQNAKVAAGRFSAVSEAILEERDLPEYATGPMKKIR